MQALVKTEQHILAECESTIKRGLSTFIDVGNALMRIRDGRLYREGHKTFEAYCQDKWGINRDYANKMIRGAAAVNNLDTIESKPATESQVRPLAGMEPEQQKEVWVSATEKAKEENRRVTAKDVEMAKAEIVVEPDEDDTSTTSTETDRPSNGIMYADMAISALSKITRNDTERKQGLRKVAEWLKRRIR